MVSRAYQVSQHFFPRSAQPFLVMTDGAFVALVFVLSNLVDWLVSLISPLAYLPPAFTQNSGWRPIDGIVFATSKPRWGRAVVQRIERLKTWFKGEVLVLTEAELYPSASRSDESQPNHNT